MHHCQAKCGISVSAAPEPPAGPHPHLVGPETTPRPLKAPQRPAIDFCCLFFFLQKQRDFLCYMIHHNHIICSSASTNVQRCHGKTQIQRRAAPAGRWAAFSSQTQTAVWFSDRRKDSVLQQIQSTEQRQCGVT